MSLYKNNPAILLRTIFREGTKLSRMLAIFGLTAAAIGAVLAFFPHGSYYLERIGQIILGLAGLVYFFLDSTVKADYQERIEKEIEKAEKAVESQPDKARPLWDLARNRLELYFQRNLSQIKSIYWVTLLVMLVGFILIGYGVLKAFESEKINAAILTTCSGVLTEFIAATFLVIYRSTLSQANNYVKTLERINAVGMAIQIVDSIPNTEVNLKNETRAKLVSEILNIFSKLDSK